MGALMSPRADVCDECRDERDEFYGFRGQIVTKGRYPLTYCKECGDIIDGHPTITQHIYRRIYGRWPWEERDGAGRC